MLPLHWAVRKLPDSRSEAFWVLLFRNHDRHVGIRPHTLTLPSSPPGANTSQLIHKFKGPTSSYHPTTPLSLGDTHVLIHVTLCIHWKFKAEHESEKGRVKLHNLTFSVNLKPWFFKLGSHWNQLGSFLNYTDAWFILLEIFLYN